VAVANISVSQKTKHYWLYSNDTLFDSLLKFFLQNEQEPLQAFAKKESMNRSTFRRFFIESGLQKLKESGCKDEEQAQLCLNDYFEKKSKNRSLRTENGTNSTRYLTDNEELTIIQLCSLLGSMGYGITRDELQEIVSKLTNFDVEQEKVEVTDKVVRGLFRRHGDLLKIVQASSLDPKRAKQASKETRDGMFTKLDSYIHLLHAMELVPWKNYQEIPPRCL